MAGTKSEARVRKNLRIPKALDAWARKYARSKHKTLTQVVIDQLMELKERESSNA